MWTTLGSGVVQHNIPAGTDSLDTRRIIAALTEAAKLSEEI